MGGGADLVVRLRIGRKLTTALRASPRFRRGDQGSADTVSTSLRHHEPSLQVGHAVAATALGAGANGQLCETHRMTATVLSEEHGEGFGRLAGKELSDFLAVVGFHALRPESPPQVKPGGCIGRVHGSNAYHGGVAAASLTDPR